LRLSTADWRSSLARSDVGGWLGDPLSLEDSAQG
jgi:hypothetical protein